MRAHIMGRIACLVSLSLLIAGCVPVSGDAAASGGVESSSRVVRLTDADFDQQVRPNEGDNGDWFVEFYAPWCGHCKNLAPTWSSLADLAASPSSSSARPLHIGSVDCTVEVAQSKRFDIRGFPSLKLFSRGRVFDYKGQRTLEALEKFARNAGEGEDGKGVPEAPSTIAVMAESMLVVAGDIQNIFVRHPLVGVTFIASGFLLGVLTCAVLFATCVEPPREYLQYQDPATGQTVTVPYVRNRANQTASTTAAGPDTAAPQPPAAAAGASQLTSRASKIAASSKNKQ